MLQTAECLAWAGVKQQIIFRCVLAQSEDISKLYQAGLTRLDIPGYPVHYLLPVIDYLSPYLLALELCPGIKTDVLLDRVEERTLESLQSWISCIIIEIEIG